MSKEFFNKMAYNWDNRVNHKPEIIKPVIENLPSLINLQGTILDVGTGTGVMIPYLRERYPGAEIVALDFAEKMVEIARNKYGHLEKLKFINGDIYQYPFDNNYFDLILCYSVFPHLMNKKQILKRFQDLLKDKGVLVIFHSQSRQAINSLHKGVDSEVDSDRLPPASEVVSMGEEIGYKKVRICDNDDAYLVILKNELI